MSADYDPYFFEMTAFYVALNTLLVINDELLYAARRRRSL